MIEKVLHFVGGIEQYGVASLCLFSALFLCVFTWALLQKRSHLEYMARLALEPERDEPFNNAPEAGTENHHPTTLEEVSHE